ncbi:GNAT family N-acetyltransferase [Candidatus Woesearchaeota archaeon]|nr:GNAT family N-acetyltransferase [Candidatus Woesearchaeota archaeon]
MTAFLFDLSKVMIKQASKEEKLTNFDCEDDDLNEFLRQDSISYKNKLIANTFLIFYNEAMIGFFSLLNDAIKLNKSDRKNTKKLESISEYPALKLGRLGIDKNWKRKGAGSFVLQAVIKIGKNMNDASSCRFITVDSYHESVLFYEKYGFIKNQAYTKKRRYVSMRFDLLDDTVLTAG